MMWGDLAHYNLDADGEIAARGHVSRTWEEDNSMLSTDQLTRKADPFIS
jgi:hypothetical protein